MSSAHQIADNLKITKPHDSRVFMPIPTDYVAYTISFQTKLKRSDTLFLLPSSAIPAHLAILCYIKKLTSSYILLKSLLAAFFLLPLTCHNIQSFKRKQNRRDKNQEKNLRRNVINRVLFLAYISIMTTKNCLAQINPQFECFLYQVHVRRVK